MTEKRFPSMRMTPRRILLGGTLLLVLTVGLWLRSERARPAGEPFVHTVAVFNTVGRISIWETDAAMAADAVRDLALVWQQLHQALNVFDPGSEVSRCNAGAADAPFACSPLLWEALAISAEGWELTGGAFDVTVSPLLQLWKERARSGVPPSADDLAAAMSRVGFQRLRLDPERRTVSYAVSGMAVNFGGMAKGLALDLARDLLAERGIPCYLLDLGGNILAGPQGPAGRRAFRIGLRHPQAPENILGAVELSGEVVATSANYERGMKMGGKTIGHIVDPRSGQTVQELEAVTAITRSGSLADIFSTAVYVDGADLAEKLSQRVSGSRFLLVRRGADGELACQRIGGGP